MHHRRHQEAQPVHSGLETIAFLHDQGALCQIEPEELLDHTESFLAAHNLHPRVEIEHARDQSAMIGFHVLDDHVIQVPTVQGSTQIFYKELANRFIGSIEEDCLLVQEQV